jgi:hypothetical protein
VNSDTGELYKSYADAEKKLLAEGLTQEQIDKRLVPISHEEYEDLSHMNRAERRRWEREKRKAKK